MVAQRLERKRVNKPADGTGVRIMFGWNGKYMAGDQVINGSANYLTVLPCQMVAQKIGPCTKVIVNWQDLNLYTDHPELATSKTGEWLK